MYQVRNISMSTPLTPKQIAKVLGLSTSYVNKQIYRLHIPKIQRGLYDLETFKQYRKEAMAKKETYIKCQVCNIKKHKDVIRNNTCLRCRLNGNSDPITENSYRNPGSPGGTKIS